MHAISGGNPARRRRRHGATGAGEGASAGGPFDYTAVGHVTVDVIDGGSRRPGGTAFYSALQASRLGLRTLILTRGAPREIEQLLAPYRAELELEVQPAEQTTTLHTSGSGAERSQRLLAWAGPIEAAPLDTGILHLAPVARETPPRWQGAVEFLGLTPQGLLRDWPREGGEISLTAAAPEAFPARCDAIVISEVEQGSCRELISRASRADTIVAVTAGARPTTILVPGSAPLQVQTAAAEDPGGDDLGAGDVFAAAFFIALREGRPARQAAGFAGAAAALRVGAAGTSGIAGRSAIESRATAAER